MTLRSLEPAEEAVFGAIVEQRNQSSSSDGRFVYSVVKGDEFLRHNDKAVRYGIGHKEQHKIIRRLVADGIIDADWVTEFDPQTLRCKFAYNDEQAISERFPLAYIDMILDVNRESIYQDFYFIDLDFAQLKKIKDTRIAKYRCTLTYDEGRSLFIISYNHERLVVGKIKYGMLSFGVLKVAVEKRGEVVTRDELNKSNDNKVHIGKRSIATQVFDINSIVRNELRPFVRLFSDSIKVTPTVRLTLLQLNKLREVCL